MTGGTLNNVLDMLSSGVKRDYGRTRNELTFEHYLDHIAKDPPHGIRTAYQYIRDSIGYFGIDRIKEGSRELLRPKIFNDPFYGGKWRIIGQTRAIDRLYRTIEACAKEETDELLMLLYGPPGTGKSKVIMLIQKAMEEYSRRDEGAIFTHRWIFGDGLVQKPSIGFNSRTQPSPSHRTHTHHIDCQIREDPLLIIPSNHRETTLLSIMDLYRKQQTAIRESKDAPQKARDEAEQRLCGLDRMIIPSKLLTAEPCLNCLDISSRLVHHYRGDWREMFKHFEVFRFTLSRGAGRGLAIVNPGVNSETRLVPMKLDHAPEIMAELLGAHRFYHFEGESVRANRGLLNFQDLFNSPYGHKGREYLNSVVEEKIIDFGGASQYIDIGVFASSNINQVEKIEGDLDARGLKDRLGKNPFPYLFNYKEEQQIYAHNVSRIRARRHIAPHTIAMGSLYMVLTRFKPDGMDQTFRSYLEKQLEDAEHRKELRIEGAQSQIDDVKHRIEIIEKITPLQRAKLYAGDLSWLGKERQKVFTPEFINAILEYAAQNEGMIDESESPRQFKQVLGALSRNPDVPCISPFDIFRHIESDLNDWESNRYQARYAHALAQVPESQREQYLESMIDRRKSYITGIVDDYKELALHEVEEAIFNVPHEDLAQRADKYGLLLKSWIRSEKVENPYTKKLVPADEFLLVEERALNIDVSKAESFRRGVFDKICAYAGKHEEEVKVYTAKGLGLPTSRAVPELIDAFKAAAHRDRKRTFQYEMFLVALNKLEQKKLRAMDTLDARVLAPGDQWVADVCEALTTLKDRSRTKAISAGETPEAGYCNHCGKALLQFVLNDQHLRERILEDKSETAKGLFS